MLEKILQTKQEELSHITVGERPDVPFYSLKKALQQDPQNVQIIAEVKKASPSKGLIRSDFDPEAIALGYEQGGAAALSVLTDETYFQGSSSYLTAVKKISSLPVLRKDFIIDARQVEESAAIGADAILLIAEALAPEKLHELYRQAYGLGMEVLVEAHSLEKLHDLLHQFTPEIIGINNRDLHTFHTELGQTGKAASFIPEGSVLVSESGFRTNEDLDYIQLLGAEAALVGESLMRQPDVREALLKLRGVNEHASTDTDV